MIVPPIPRPIHIVVMPYLTSGCSAKAFAKLRINLTPEDASGWPTAIAPP